MSSYSSFSERSLETSLHAPCSKKTTFVTIFNPRPGQNRQRDRDQPPSNRPPRDPTEDEIEGVMNFVGFSRELVVPAIQMANFDLLTAQNLLLDDVAGIVAFAQRQNALKE